MQLTPYAYLQNLLAALPESNTFAALVTAAATAVLAWLTWILARETRESRDANAKQHRDNLTPHLALFTDVDEVTHHVNLVLENVTPNPAFSVSVDFNPDCRLPIYKSDTRNDEDPVILSKLGYGDIAMVGPRQRISKTYTLFTDGTGDFAEVPDFTTTATIRFKDREGNDYAVEMAVNSSATNRGWWGHQNNLISLTKQIKKSTDVIAKAIGDNSRRSQAEQENHSAAMAYRSRRASPMMIEDHTTER